MENKYIIRDKFDFEVGQLIKSPCLECPDQEKFPKCSDKCKMLDKVRDILAKGVSCTYSGYEP